MIYCSLQLKNNRFPGWIAQLVRVSASYMVVGLIPGQGTYKNQPMALAGVA